MSRSPCNALITACSFHTHTQSMCRRQAPNEGQGEQGMRGVQGSKGGDVLAGPASGSQMEAAKTTPPTPPAPAHSSAEAFGTNTAAVPPKYQVPVQ